MPLKNTNRLLIEYNVLVYENCRMKGNAKKGKSLKLSQYKV